MHFPPQTTTVGTALTTEQFLEECRNHFDQGRACVGCIDSEEEQLKQDYLVSHTPVSRKISKDCQKVLALTEEVQSCAECLKLKELRVLGDVSAAVNCKVEILSDEEVNGERPKKKPRKRRKAKQKYYKEEWDDEEYYDPSYDYLLNDSTNNVNDTKYDKYDNDKYDNNDEHYEAKAPKGKMKCPWCDDTFGKYSGAFAIHRKIKHFWGIFKCPQCKIRTDFAGDMVGHIQQEEHGLGGQINCPNCKNKVPVIELVSHYEDCVVEGFTKCPWCTKRFSGTSGGFDIHRKKVHFWGVFKCPECDTVANFAKDLLEHMQAEKHTEDPNVVCPHCKNKYSTDEIAQHYEGCVSGGWKLKKCPNCKKKFPKEEIWAHEEICGAKAQPKQNSENMDDMKEEGDNMADGATGETTPYLLQPATCSVCSMNFATYNKMSYHRRRTHFWGVFYCPQCHWKENFAKDIVEHMQLKDHLREPLVKCPICKENYQMTEIGPHYEECIFKGDGKNTMCTTCGKTFYDSKGYNRHMKVHLRAQGLSEEAAKMVLYYYCDRCGKRFTQSTDVKNHIRRVHEGIKTPSTCPVCLLTFDTESKMRRHKMLEHPSDEKFQCQHCGKNCGNLSTLKIHMRKHEEPQFKCGFCKKMLKSKKSLLIHEREHTGERPFKCTICSNSYKSSDVLGTHMKYVHKMLTPRMKPAEKRVRKNKEPLC